MQAVVVAIAVLQQQRCRPGLTGGMTAVEECFMVVGIADLDAHGRVPSIGDVWKSRIERRPQLATVSGSGYAKYLYSPRPKPWRPITIRLRKCLSSG